MLTALASVILYPHLADPETGYIKVMVDYLPWYFRGLMVAAFAAAYMSTIATQLNWGASYLVNDFYRRFLKKNETDKHYVRVSQLATIGLTIISVIVTRHMDSISGAWKLVTLTGAGTGGVLLLRWFWWRVNAWSEVSSMIAAFLVSVYLQLVYGLDSDRPRDFAWIIIVTVGITTAVWLLTTYLTKPETDEVLVQFYRRTRPSLAGWRRVAALAPDVKPSTRRLVQRDGLDCGMRADLWPAVRRGQADSEGVDARGYPADRRHSGRYRHLLGLQPARLEHYCRIANRNASTRT